MSWKDHLTSPYQRIFLAGIIPLPAFLILAATGHLTDSITAFHMFTAVTMEMLVFPRVLTVRLSMVRPIPLAWLPAVIAVIDIPAAVYVAVTDTVIRVPSFTLSASVSTITGSIALLHLAFRERRSNHPY